MGGCEEVKDKKCPSTGDGEGDDMKGVCGSYFFVRLGS